MKVEHVSTEWSLSVGQATEGWLLHVKARNLSPMTVKAYRAASLGLAAYLGKQGMPTNVEAITSEHVEAYLESEVRTKAAATAHQRYRGLKQFFKWLRSQGDIQVDPMANIQPPIVPEHHINTVTDADFRAMLKTCEDSLEGLRDAAILRTLWDTGGRLAEVTGLKVADVNFTEQVVRLFGKGRRFRSVYIAPSTGAAIHRYLRRRAKSRVAVDGPEGADDAERDPADGLATLGTGWSCEPSTSTSTSTLKGGRVARRRWLGARAAEADGVALPGHGREVRGRQRRTPEH